MENTVPGKLPPGIFPPMLLNIPTRFWRFFHYCHRYHWYYLKNCFVILCFKSQTWCGVKKNGACRPILLHTQKSFAGQVWESVTIISTCLLWNFFILEAEEWDVTQFNLINLNSSFSVGLLLINWKQLLRLGLLYCIKVTEDTVRHDEKISNIFSSKVLCL